MGDNVRFEDDRWVCTNMAQSNVKSKSSCTIYFSNAPKEYKELVKYYALVMIKARRKIKTVKNNVSDFITYLLYIQKYYNGVELNNVDYIVLKQYEGYLNTKYESEDTKHAKWTSVSNFYRMLRNADGLFNYNPVYKNPFEKKRCDSNKYIPEYILNQTDEIFKDINMPITIRCIYWILRFIPSRLNEVMEMKLESVNFSNEGWILTMPTWKQNGGYAKPENKLVRFKKESKECEFLLELIQEQQALSRALQDKVEESKKGYLFTYYKPRFKPKESAKCNQKIYGHENVICVASMNTPIVFFNLMGNRYNITDEKGNITTFKSHGLRHNGITDRFNEGFEPVHIKQMTLHKNDSMLLNNYNHIDKDIIIEKQNKVIESRKQCENVKSDDEPVYFRGRILNIDASMEKRLLSNIRAHKVKHGICTDITTCKNKYECLDKCKYFVPNTEDLDYFKNQVKQWEEKVDFFTKQGHHYMVENSKYNLELNVTVVRRIEKALTELS